MTVNVKSSETVTQRYTTVMTANIRLFSEEKAGLLSLTVKVKLRLLPFVKKALTLTLMSLRQKN